MDSELTANLFTTEFGIHHLHREITLDDPVGWGLVDCFV